MKKWTDLYSVNDLTLFENEFFIVLNKPPGVNTQDDLTGDLSLCSWLEESKGARLHLVNRLDRPVSGIVLFSRNKKAHKLIMNSGPVHKRYVALTTPLPQQSGSLAHFIKKDGSRKKAIISDIVVEGYKPCRLEYKLLHQLTNYHLLSIRTFSGRFHQIRAQLAHFGYPIRGDVKYGARRSNKDRSIDLHALNINLPVLGKEIRAIPIGREKIWQDLLDLGVL